MVLVRASAGLGGEAEVRGEEQVEGSGVSADSGEEVGRAGGCRGAWLERSS